MILQKTWRLCLGFKAIIKTGANYSRLWRPIREGIVELIQARGDADHILQGCEGFERFYGVELNRTW